MLEINIIQLMSAPCQKHNYIVYKGGVKGGGGGGGERGGTYIVIITDAVYSGSSAHLTCRNFVNGVTVLISETEH